jgi:hypothetical protein
MQKSLFGSEHVDKIRSELLIALVPHIVRPARAAKGIAERRKFPSARCRSSWKQAGRGITRGLALPATSGLVPAGAKLLSEIATRGDELSHCVEVLARLEKKERKSAVVVRGLP